jgi:hypothetical protein
MSSLQPPPPSQFSAADSTLGYLYQVRVALWWSLRKLRAGTEFAVSLETLDDVAFEPTGRPEELLQTKHHQSRQADLTDASPDLWKSLRVWFETFKDKPVLPGTSLHLLTTATAASGSAAAYLRIAERNMDAALALLESTAQTSRNQDNAAAYRAFQSASSAVRKSILDCVVVIDAAAPIAALDDELRQEVFWAVERKHQLTFLQYMEGWWFRRVVKQLLGISRGDRILSAEVEAEMSDLRERFKHDSLPIADDLLAFTPDKALIAVHEDSQFVRQLQLVNAGRLRITAAIRDYCRAFEQRSRWLRDKLLMVGELDKYEKRLVEEWELVFAAMQDEIGEAAAERAKQEAARELLQWAERTLYPIRPAVSEPFVCRGSFHILADDLRVGWHPDFRERLSRLLTGATATTAQ